MSQQDLWSKVLAEQVVTLCRDNNSLMENDYEPQVKRWLSDIAPANRPTLSGVMMRAKRELWNLTPLA